MTMQDSDYLFYEGVQWIIDDQMEEGLYGPICGLTPEPKDFGIFHAQFNKTSSQKGYLTNYMIFMGRLYLFKYDINSIENDIEELAKKYRCEKTTTFSALDTYTEGGLNKEIYSNENYSVYIDNYIIKYTGKIFAHGPYIEFWNQPTTDLGEEKLEKELMPTKTMEIDFLEGHVTKVNIRSLVI